MRKQVGLMDRLVHMWDPDLKVFQVGNHVLEIEIEEIYFITGVSKRGALVLMSGQRIENRWWCAIARIRFVVLLTDQRGVLEQRIYRR